MSTNKNNLKETVDRGNPPIPFYIYHQYHNKYNLYLHWHNEIEIVYVEKGSLTFIVDTVPIKISEGQCIIISSGQLHSANCTDNDVSLHHALLFDLNLLSSSSFDYCQNKYIDPLLNGEYRFPLIIDEKSQWGCDVIREVKEAIDVYDKKDFGWEMGIKASLYKILSFIAREDKFIVQKKNSISSKNYKVDIVKKALNYIQNHYNKKIYIENIANEVNMNPQYFCRFFKSNTGKTPVDFINQYRIEQAANILKTEDKKISEVCFEVGFDNFSYFIRKFKQYKNCTPSKYKDKF